jgi:hypothetical protein
MISVYHCSRKPSLVLEMARAAMKATAPLDREMKKK